MRKTFPSAYQNFLLELLLGDMTLVSETKDVIRFLNFSVSKPLQFDILRKFIHELNKQVGWNVNLVGNISGDFELEKISIQNVQNETLRLVINKSEENGNYYFLSLDGFNNALKDDIFLSTAKKIWVADKFEPFSNFQFEVFPWEETLNQNERISNLDWKGLADPRKIVRDFSLSPNQGLCDNLKPWFLLQPDYKSESKVFRLWKVASARHLLMTIPKEVEVVDAAIKITFKAERSITKEQNISDDTMLELFPIIYSCASWVYLIEQETETKHAILNYHLVFLLSQDSAALNAELFQNALDSAQETYKLHLFDSSKELLKTLSEIKNSLQNEVDRMSSNTHSVIRNFWRDFAIAATVVAINFISELEKIPRTGIKVLSIATGAFLVLSLLITLFVNCRFNTISRENRNNWRKRLYFFIDQKNFEILVDRPISKGLTTYRWVAGVICVIYFVIIAYLLNLALNFC